VLPRHRRRAAGLKFGHNTTISGPPDYSKIGNERNRFLGEDLHGCQICSFQCENIFNQTPIRSLEEGISIDQDMSEEDVVFEDCETLDFNK
jgi:hypothetical protein